MKNKLGLLASSLVILAAQSNVAAAQDLWGCITPYVGVDVGWRHQGFQAALGGNLVPKNYPQGDAYVGAKLNDYLGVQVGYEATSSKHRTSKFTVPFIAFGRPVNPDDSFPIDEQAVTSTRLYGWHADLVGFYPLCVCGENFNLIGSLGIANKRLKIKYFPTFSEGIVSDGTDISEFTRHFLTTKYTSRIAVGLQYMITKCTDVRVMAGWENTARFRNIAANDNRTGPSRTTLKNAFTLGFGVSYNF